MFRSVSRDVFLDFVSEPQVSSGICCLHRALKTFSSRTQTCCVLRQWGSFNVPYCRLERAESEPGFLPRGSVEHATLVSYPFPTDLGDFTYLPRRFVFSQNMSSTNHVINLSTSHFFECNRCNWIAQQLVHTFQGHPTLCNPLKRPPETFFGSTLLSVLIVLAEHFSSLFDAEFPLHGHRSFVTSRSPSKIFLACR